MDKSEKILELISNEDIAKELSNAESKEAMIEIFGNNGIEMSIEDIDMFINTMNYHCDSEFSEDDLDNVAGGAAGATAIQVFGWACQAVQYTAKAAWNAGRWFRRHVG